MKRNLFTIAAGLLIGFGATAQGVKLCEREGWAVVDSTKSNQSINVFDIVTAADPGCNWSKQYTINWSEDGKELVIGFTKGENTDQEGNNWDNVKLMTQEFDGADDGDGKPTLTSKFAKITTACGGASIAQEKPMIQRGNVVDFSNPENAYVTFWYKLESSNPSVKLQFDLVDILGRASNANETDGVSRVTGFVDPTDEWKTMICAWNPEPGDYDLWTDKDVAANLIDGKLALYDRYSPDFLEVKNPCVDAVPGSLLATDKITGIMIAIFPDITCEVGDKAKLTIRQLKIGGNTPNPCPDCVGIKTIEGGEVTIINGVVYSAAIVVTSIAGQVVATAQKEFDTKSLKGGIYVIKTAEGTVKFVK